MIKTVAGTRAHELETILSAKSSERYTSRKLYAVEGYPGLWRRTKDPKVALPASVGVFPAFFLDGIIYLTPDADSMEEMEEVNSISALPTDPNKMYSVRQYVQSLIEAFESCETAKPDVPQGGIVVAKDFNDDDVVAAPNVIDPDTVELAPSEPATDVIGPDELEGMIDL